MASIRWQKSGVTCKCLDSDIYVYLLTFPLNFRSYILSIFDFPYISLLIFPFLLNPLHRDPATEENSNSPLFPYPPPQSNPQDIFTSRRLSKHPNLPPRDQLLPRGQRPFFVLGNRAGEPRVPGKTAIACSMVADAAPRYVVPVALAADAAVPCHVCWGGVIVGVGGGGREVLWVGGQWCWEWEWVGDVLGLVVKMCWGRG